MEGHELGPFPSSCAFVNHTNGRSARPSKTSPKLAAFSLPRDQHGDFFFFFNSVGYKIGLLLLRPTSPLPFAELMFMILLNI